MLILHSNFLKEKKLSFCLCFRVSSNDYGITEVISIQFGDITCVCIPVIPRSWTVSRARRKDNSRIHSRIRISSPNRTITRLPRRSQYRPRYYASLYTRALAFAMLFPCGYERDREKERETMRGKFPLALRCPSSERLQDYGAIPIYVFAILRCIYTRVCLRPCPCPTHSLVFALYRYALRNMCCAPSMHM